MMEVEKIRGEGQVREEMIGIMLEGQEGEGMIEVRGREGGGGIN